jgi:colanic acid/amylovoran biosynthesis glycosyltransferase
MRVGYIVSEYPKVSHTFIRREIEAVEACGIDVERISIRDGGEVVDPRDLVEHGRTTRLLDRGTSALLGAGLRCLLRAPLRSLRTFLLACRMGLNADRPMPVHWVYFLEAAMVADLVRRRAINHLHAHFGSNPAEVAMLAAQLSGITFSFTAHGTVETDNARAIGLPAKIRAAAFVVAVSDYGRAQMMRWIPPEQWSRIHVVHCGLGPEYLDSTAPPIDGGAGFLAVGRLSEEKGHVCLVNAFARMLNTGTRSRLVLAGDGPLRGVIESRCRELGIADRVRITGWVSGEQVRQLLLESRALVLPSFAEGLPVVLMESLALGRPVVSSWVAGVPELVEAGTSGWLVPPGNEDALGQAMQHCMDASSETLAAMGKAGQQAVRQRHDARTEGARLAGLFRAVGSAQRESR